eukprot:7075935-Lingulodinium_polyedra.AAC.1
MPLAGTLSISLSEGRGLEHFLSDWDSLAVARGHFWANARQSWTVVVCYAAPEEVVDFTDRSD